MFVRRVVALTIVAVALAAFIFVSWPGYMTRGPDTPWDYVGMLVRGAIAGSPWSLAVLALGGLAIVAIVVATVWLSRWVANGEPG